MGLRLRDLPAAFAEIGERIEALDGELPPGLENELDALEATLEQKVDAIVELMGEADIEAEFFAKEQARVTQRRRVAENRSAGLKSYLLRNLTALGIDKVKGQHHRARIQRNGVPSIRWTRPLEELPPAFRRITVDVDTQAAKDAWKLGELPEGFEATIGTHLRAD